MRALAVLLILLVPERDAPPTAEAELMRLQGSWQVIAMQDRGEKVAEVVARAIELVIQKDSAVLQTGGEIGGAFQLRLDPTGEPRKVDLTSTRDEDAGTRYAGIYRVEGDRLQIALNEPGRHRPRGFMDRELAGMTVLVLRKKN